MAKIYQLARVVRNPEYGFQIEETDGYLLWVVVGPPHRDAPRIYGTPLAFEDQFFSTHIVYNEGTVKIPQKVTELLPYFAEDVPVRELSEWIGMGGEATPTEE